MDAEDDDDIYASGPADGITQTTKSSGIDTTSPQIDNGQRPADLEEGEEEDEDEEEESDSVIRLEPWLDSTSPDLNRT